MTLKQFLKPDWRKIMIFCVILAIFFLFKLNFRDQYYQFDDWRSRDYLSHVFKPEYLPQENKPVIAKYAFAHYDYNWNKSDYKFSCFIDKCKIGDNWGIAVGCKVFTNYAMEGDNGLKQLVKELIVNCEPYNVIVTTTYFLDVFHTYHISCPDKYGTRNMHFWIEPLIEAGEDFSKLETAKEREEFRKTVPFKEVSFRAYEWGDYYGCCWTPSLGNIYRRELYGKDFESTLKFWLPPWYLIIIWYLLSCLIVWIYDKYKKK